LWDSLGIDFQIDTNDTCSTHVHISPDEDWKLEQVQRIACAALYFEAAFEFLLPKSRRGNEWAKSNRVDNALFKGKDVKTCIKEVLTRTTINDVANLMCNGDRHHGWNFTSFVDDDDPETIPLNSGVGLGA